MMSTNAMESLRMTFLPDPLDKMHPLHFQSPLLALCGTCWSNRPAITVKDNPLFVQIEIPDSVDLSTYGIPFFIINNPALPKDTLYLLRKRYPNSIFIMKYALLAEIVHVEEVKEWIGNETLPPESLIKKGIYPTVPTAPPVYPWTEPAEPRVRGRPGPFTPPSVNGIPTLPPGSESFIYPTAPTAPPVYPWTEPAEPRVRGRPGPFTPPSVDGKPTLPPGSESFTYPTPPTPVYPWTAPARPGGQGMPGPFTTPSSVFVPYTTPPAMPGPTPPSPDHDRGTNLDPRHPRPREGPDGFRPIPLPGPEGYGPTPSPGGVPFLDPERPLILDAYVISESIMNMVLENVVYLKACIIVMNSNYTRLRLPRLQRLESCDPNRPAIYLFNNLYLVEFYLPPNVIYPNYGVPVIVQLNPLLPLIQLVRYQEQCPNCRFIDDVGCGMGYRSYTELEFVQKCKGSAIIKPALPEFKIEIHSDTVDQVMMYELCKNAIYMEICITIRKSTIKSLRCPKLRMLKPCEPGSVFGFEIDNAWRINNRLLLMAFKNIISLAVIFFRR
ncbi:hypothetical protein ANCCAN_01005 [Ancylostoma caninum]|uniref:Uncharacterized protein n=1 Tax=Ancylostoma caninum TaxID=29170 RepID=A0A368HBE2_ANCCA|nr:hypothetical protein ANCCAN_01005 [Ancylostoma caninum]